MARPRGSQEMAGTSIRLPVGVDRLWEALAARMAMPKTSVLVFALRQLAKAEGIDEASYLMEETTNV
jgi:hypothetical protein